jgi:hypothetical protein
LPTDGGGHGFDTAVVPLIGERGSTVGNHAESGRLAFDGGCGLRLRDDANWRGRRRNELIVAVGTCYA